MSDIWRKKPWGINSDIKSLVSVGKLSLENDCSIVMKGQVVGQLTLDGNTSKENDDIAKEMVRRWNAFEKEK